MTYYFKHPWTPSFVLFSGSIMECIEFGDSFIAKVEQEEGINFDLIPIDYVIDSETYKEIYS